MQGGGHPVWLVLVLKREREELLPEMMASPLVNSSYNSEPLQKVPVNRQKSKPRAAAERPRVHRCVFQSSTLPPVNPRAAVHRKRVQRCVFQSSTLPRKKPRWKSPALIPSKGGDGSEDPEANHLVA